MKNHILIIFSFAIISMAFVRHKPNHLPTKQYLDFNDTMPEICLTLPPKDIATLHPFTSQLSNIFPDPNNFETYSGCHYQFYTPDDYPQLAVRLIRWGSKKEAGDDFKMQVQSHFDLWGLVPERIYGVADSAYFGFNADDTTKCDECGLVAIQGVYGITISFKGQYEKVSRARKKQSALQILQLMFARIPGLAP